MAFLDSILKSRDITLLTKVCLVKAMVFPGVICEYELEHKEGKFTVIKETVSQEEITIINVYTPNSFYQ